jgi:hypothetical protein
VTEYDSKVFPGRPLPLSKRRAMFTRDVVTMIARAYLVFDGDIALDECKRPHLVAEHYAELGIGVLDSQHLDGLAVDLVLWREGDPLKDFEAYRFLGEIWQTLSPFNRWGGDFPRKDGDHFERYGG